MEIKIVIELRNEALMEDEDRINEVELRRILCSVPPKVSEQLYRDPQCVCYAPEVADKLIDINGNTVGQVVIIHDGEEDPDLKTAFAYGHKHAAYELQSLANKLPSRERRLVSGIADAMEVEGDLETAALFAIRYSDEVFE